MREIHVAIDSIRSQIHKIALFRHLSGDAVERLISVSGFMEADEGEYVIREHEIGVDVYVILEGQLAIMVDEAGTDQYVATLGPGQIVGEAALFANQPRTASAVAQCRVRLMTFERSSFLTALRADPLAGMKVLITVIHALLAKLREVNHELAFERRDNAAQDDVDSIIQDMLNS